MKKNIISILIAMSLASSSFAAGSFAYAAESGTDSDISSPYAKGDANCDGEVDMADAVLIMQALSNPDKYGESGTAENHLTAQGKENADMDGDGLTVKDAQIIQQILLGIDPFGTIDDTDNSDIFIGYDDDTDGKPLPSARILMKCRPFCEIGEKLTVDVLMGDISLSPQNYDSTRVYEYSIYPVKGWDKITDDKLVVNGEVGEYSEEYSGEGIQVFDIGGKRDDYDSYYHKTAEINFSNYEAGDAGCIVFSFKAVFMNEDGTRPLNPSTDGTLQMFFYYVGEKGVAISNSIENAEKAYNAHMNISGETKTSAELLGLKDIDLKSVDVRLYPTLINPVFTGDKAQAIVDYLSDLSLVTDYTGEPDEYADESWDINLEYEDNEIISIYQRGNKFIKRVNDRWYGMNEEEASRLGELINSLIADNDTSSDPKEDDTDYSGYLIGPNESSSVMTPQRLALYCKSFCETGETLSVDMIMGDEYSKNQKFNYYPNFDSEGHPEYSIFESENYKKSENPRLIINGESSEYIKVFSKEDMNSLDISDCIGEYDRYYHESAAIDFSGYEIGSTGCITFGFGWKIVEGVNPYNPNSDFIGTSKTLYFYVGDKGVGISISGSERAQIVYEERFEDTILCYDSNYVKWHGKEVFFDLYEELRKNNDETIPVIVRLDSTPEWDYEYNGRTLEEYASDKYSMNEDINKLVQLLDSGEILKYGEVLYTEGTPDGIKWPKEQYDYNVEFFGEESLSKYIVDGEFLRDQLTADIAELRKSYREAYDEAEKAYLRHISSEAVKQIEAQNIEYELRTSPDRLVVYVTSEEFDSLLIDHVLRYYLERQRADNNTAADAAS